MLALKTLPFQRIRKPQPLQRLSRRKRMTVAAGFMFDDGILFCVDTKVSTSIKTNESKLLFYTHGMGVRIDKNKARAKVKARMEKNLEDRQKAYGPGFTPDGLPEPAPIGLSELKKQTKSKRGRRPKFMEVGFTEHDSHPRFSGGIRWKQGGLPGSGKRR